jgi:multicomponent Na+:H+ antiporter subunit D
LNGIDPAQVLPLAVIAPITGAILTPLAARISRHLALALAVAAAAAGIAALAVNAPTAYRGEVSTAYLGGWSPIEGHSLGIAITADAFGLTAALLAAGIGTLALLATLSGMDELGPRELGGYACLSLLVIASVIGGALTTDLLNLFVWFEVAALASYALTGFFLSRPPAVEAAFKIVVLTSVAGFLVFIATAVLYQTHGAVNLAQLSQALANNVGPLDAIALGLLLAGFATKAGLAPFSGWLPDAHTAAPGPISALFSAVLVNFGVVALARIDTAFAPARLPLAGVLMVLGVGSALLGAGFAAAQDDLKRLLAYDTISQIGIILVGLAARSDTGAAGLTFHLANHALFKALLFLIAGAIVHTTGATSLSELAGLGRRSPWLASLFALGAAAIAGIPPLNGYVSLSLIHSALLDKRQYLPYALVLVAQAVTVAALGRVVVAMFRPGRDRYHRDERMRPGLAIALATLATACVAAGVFGPAILHQVIAPAAADLTQGTVWTTAVLAGHGRLDIPPIAFDYTSLGELTATAGCLIVGVLLLRRFGPQAERIRGRLTLVATGSVNDYTAYLAAGTIAACTALAIWRAHP